MTKEELLNLYKILEQKILNNKELFKEKKFKDNELIQILLEIILKESRINDTNILKYIDFEDIDMTGQNLIFINMSDSNIKFDPQTIKDKDLQYATLEGDFKGKSFDGVFMCGTDCSKATNISIHPQKLKNKKINNANVDGVDFNNESFDGIEHEGTDFSKSKNCVLQKSEYYKYKQKILEINNSK